MALGWLLAMFFPRGFVLNRHQESASVLSDHGDRCNLSYCPWTHIGDAHGQQHQTTHIAMLEVRQPAQPRDGDRSEKRYIHSTVRLSELWPSVVWRWTASPGDRRLISTLQETTKQDAGDVGQVAAGLSCPGSSYHEPITGTPKSRSRVFAIEVISRRR